jgi:hypothetical protein
MADEKIILAAGSPLEVLEVLERELEALGVYVRAIPRFEGYGYGFAFSKRPLSDAEVTRAAKREGLV